MSALSWPSCRVESPKKRVLTITLPAMAIPPNSKSRIATIKMTFSETFQCFFAAEPVFLICFLPMSDPP